GRGGARAAGLLAAPHAEIAVLAAGADGIAVAGEFAGFAQDRVGVALQRTRAVDVGVAGIEFEVDTARRATAPVEAAETQSCIQVARFGIERAVRVGGAGILANLVRAAAGDVRGARQAAAAVEGEVAHRTHRQAPRSADRAARVWPPSGAAAGGSGGTAAAGRQLAPGAARAAAGGGRR